MFLRDHTRTSFFKISCFLLPNFGSASDWRSASVSSLITSLTECAVPDPDLGPPGFMTAEFDCQIIREIRCCLSSHATPRWVKYSSAMSSTGEKSISSGFNPCNNTANESLSDINGRVSRVSTMKETNQPFMEAHWRVGNGNEDRTHCFFRVAGGSCPALTRTVAILFRQGFQIQ